MNTIVYMCLLMWTFLGVAIAADVFMTAIEVCPHAHACTLEG